MENPIEYEEIPEDAEDQCVPSDKQRLRIHVPYKNTTLTMGEKADDQAIRDEDRGDLNFPGFGATTQGHVFLDANGEAADSMMRLQSKGHLTVQTPSKLAAGGKEGTILASEVSTVVAGGGGVSILGGSAIPWTDNQVNDATAPDSPGWISELKNSADNWSNFWLLMDAAVAGFGVAQQTAAAAVGGMDLHAAGAAAMTGLIGIKNAVSNTLGLEEGIGQELAETGGTTIHGTSGLIMGSGGTAGFYSLLGTAIASPAAVSISGLVTDIFGRVAATVSSSRLTSITSEKSVNVVSGKHTLVTTREGDTVVGGKGVSIGVTSDISDAMQDATEGISLQANESVSAAAPDVSLTGSAAVTIAGGEINIAGDKTTLNGGDALVQLGSEAVLGLAESAPDLAKVAQLEKDLAAAYSDHAAALETKAVWREAYDKKADEHKAQALAAAAMRAEKVAETIDSLKSEISGLKAKKNSITFKSDGIEIVFKGTKFKLDDSCVKSGPIKWKTS